jgi:alanine-synthesizing transaminase
VFSQRIPGDLAPNRLARAVVRLRCEGREFIDLTQSNPTRAGFEYPVDLLAPLSNACGAIYDPHPLGSLEARRAVAGDYARRGIAIEPGRIALTAGTSEAYSLLFKLMADPEDEVLVPRPSYPLFEHLTRLDAVVARPYDLEYHGQWSIDRTSVAEALSQQTRALLVVHPNNPTGSFVRRDDLQWLAERCAERDLALVSDEVFADYELEPGAAAAAGRVLDCGDVLAFALGGVSKSAGLPQVKLGWIAAAGPDALVDRALDRLEFACDTYLSVSTPVQCAAAELLQRGAGVRAQIQARVAANYRRLRCLAEPKTSCRVLRAEGGWYAVLEVPSIGTEEEIVLDLLEQQGVLVHPGYFFDFPREAYLVVSLLVPERLFEVAARRVLRRCDQRAGLR